MKLTESLAKFIVGTNYSDMPAPVIAAAKERLLDTIGAMLLAVPVGPTVMP